MARKFNELTCNLSEGQVALRFKKSETFLSDPNAELELGGRSLIGLWFCRLLFWPGLLSLLGILGLAFYIWMWDSSPLTSTTEADITGYERKSQGGLLRYEYEVDRQTHTAATPTNSFSSEWEESEATTDIVYLKVAPGSSKPKINVERMDWSILILGPIMPLGLLLGGWFGRRAMERMARIEENATHLLHGVVNDHFPSKGQVIVQYKAIPPISGHEIIGAVQVGKLEPTLKQLYSGAPVAVVYASDKEHTLL